MEGEESGPSCPQLVCSTRLRFQKDVTRVSMNATSNLAVLCTKKLSIIGLTAPFALAREITLPNKSAPNLAQFSPHASQGSSLAACAGQSVFLFNLNDTRSAPVTLAHQRNVRWFSWSLFDGGNVIATCAADNSIHLWDVRDARKPSSSLKVFTSGLSSVKFNKVNQHILASVHDIQVEIWDLRRTSSSPVTFITAHPTKISNIDWNGSAENELLTSSADGTVKFWDIKRSRLCQGTINTGSPVVKACYGPAQTTLVLNGALHMTVYSCANLSSGPILELSGNKEHLCPDFAMCERIGGLNKEVVSWSKDAHLCMWELPDASSQTSSSVGPLASSATLSMHQSSSAPSLSALPSSPAPRHTIRDAPSTPGKAAQSLRDELDDMEQAPIEGLVTENQVAALSRQVIARTTDYAGRTVALKISFPSLYPHNAAPAFEFLPESQLGTESMVALLSSMQSLCRRLTSHSQFCLRPVLTLLRRSVMSEELLMAQRSKRSSTLVKTGEGAVGLVADGINNGSSSSSSGSNNSSISSGSSGNSSSGNGGGSLPQLPAAVGALQAAELPCPRLSGASFAPNGRLVCFSNLGINFTVRTFSRLRDTLAGGALHHQSIRSSPLPMENDVANVIQPVVTHFNLLHVSPLSIELATNYLVCCPPGSVMSVRALCLHNANTAMQAGARAIARAWSSLASVSHACESGALAATHTLARGLVHQILDHFERACDLQSVAVMSRVLLSNAKRPHAPPSAATVSALADRAVKASRSKTSVSAAGGAAVVPAATTEQSASDRVWTKRLFQKNKVKPARSDSDAELVQQLAPQQLAPGNVTGYLISSPPAVSVTAVSNVGLVVSGSSSSSTAGTFGSSASGPIVMLEPEKSLIDPLRVSRYLAFQSIYAEQCLSFGLFKERARMLKSSLRLPTAFSPVKGGLSFEPSCTVCSRNVVGAAARFCPSCRVVPLFPCSLCRLPVRGLFSVCALCGHGCHTSCLRKWVSTNAGDCPMQGCNCKCSSSGGANK